MEDSAFPVWFFSCRFRVGRRLTEVLFAAFGFSFPEMREKTFSGVFLADVCFFG